MALVSDNTTATGYGQAPKPAPLPAALSGAPIPTYNGYVDDSTAYNASVLGTVPPVAGGGPVITVPDAPLYRDPNNPAVVWDEQYQRWYDTKSGLWRNPDTGVWENFEGTQTWNPNTGKTQATSSLTITPKSDIQPTAAGMAAAKALIQGGGKNTILTTPDRPKSAADFAALSSAPDPFEGIIPSPYQPEIPGTVYAMGAPLPGTLYDMGDGTFATGTDATGWEYLTADELEQKYGTDAPGAQFAVGSDATGWEYLTADELDKRYGVQTPNIGPEVGAAIDLAYSNAIDAQQRSYRLPGAVTYLSPLDVPLDVPAGNTGFYAPSQATINKGQLLPVGEVGQHDLGPFTASLYDAPVFDPVRDRLPGFVNESLDFGLSPLGIAMNVALPFSGAGVLATKLGLGTGGKLAANVGLNVAQDLAFGATKEGAEALGAPAPLSYALGFAAAAGSEAVVGRAITKAAARGALDMPTLRPLPDMPKVEGTPFTSIDDFTGAEVRVTLPDGSVVPGVDMGAASVPGARAVLMPDGSTWEVETSALARLEPPAPLTPARQIDIAEAKEVPVDEGRAAYPYQPAPVGPSFRTHIESEISKGPTKKGVATYTDDVTGDAVGSVVKTGDKQYTAVLDDGTVVGTTYKSPTEAGGALKGAYVATKNGRDVRVRATDLVKSVRSATVNGKTVSPVVADNVAAAALVTDKEIIERAARLIESEVKRVDFAGMNLADLGYVMWRDEAGNAMSVSKLVEYRKLDDAVRYGRASATEFERWRSAKDILNQEYRIATGGVPAFDENGLPIIVKSTGLQKIDGGREPTWLLPKGSRDTMYDTREMHQAAIREAGGDNDAIMAILPEGPGLKGPDGKYMHGTLLSYMRGRDWRKTLELERAALSSKNSNDLIKAKLEQARVTGVDFNPFDWRTKYGLFLNDPQVKQAAERAAKSSALDTAVPGSVANVRAIRAVDGTAEPLEVAIHVSEVNAQNAQIVAVMPPKAMPSSPQISSLVAKTDAPRRMTRIDKVARAGGVAWDVGLTPVYALRNFKLAGDTVLGRQLRRLAANHPGEAAKAYKNTFAALKSKATRDELWEYIAREAPDRPHLDLLIRGNRASLEQEMYIGNLASKMMDKTPLGVVEDVNALVINMARISLDDKLTAMAVRPSTTMGKLLPWKDGGGKSLNFQRVVKDGVGYRVPADEITAEYMAAQGARISILTGRGASTILNNNPGIVKGLNMTGFISARFTLSTFQFWGQLIPATASFAAKTGFGNADPFLLRQAWTRTILAASVGASAYALLSQVPGIQTVQDTTSSKFGSFKWRGNWYDFLGGLEEPIRLFSQMEAGYGTSARGYKYQFREDGSANERVNGALKAGWAYIQNRMPPASREISNRIGITSPFPEEQSIPFLPDWSARWTPLSLGQLFEMWQKVNSPGDGFWATLDSLLVFGGEGVQGPSKLEKWEQGVVSDKKMAAALDDDAFWGSDADGNPLPRNDYANLSSAGRAYIANNPELFGERPYTSSGEFRRNNELAEKQRTSTRLLLEQAGRELRAGGSGVDYRKTESTLMQSLAVHLNDIYGEFDDKESTDGVDVYYDAIDRYTYTDDEGNEVIDWEGVDDFVANEMTSLQRAQLKRFQEEISARGTEEQQQLDKAKVKLEESGYWDLKNEFYQTWVLDHPELQQYASYSEWRDAVMAAGIEASKGVTGGAFEVDFKAGLNAMTAAAEKAGFTDAYKESALYPWVLDNPSAARAAADWGYYTPDNTAKEFLFGSEEEVAAAQEGYAIKLKAKETMDTVTATSWQTWAAASSAPALSDGRTAAAFRGVPEYIAALTDELRKEKESQLGRGLTTDELAEVDAIVAEATDPYTQNYKQYGTPVRYSYVSKGKTISSTGYISQERKAEYDSWVAFAKQDPAAFQRMVDTRAIKDPSTVGRAYLESQGLVVEWPPSE